LSLWCKRYGVKRHYSAVEVPQQNGRAERMNRTLIERSRALLLQRDCPAKFWPLAMEAACFLRNRVPSGNHMYTPFEYMFRKVPDLSMLRVFGCSASLCLPKRWRGDKFDAVSVAGIFVGYSEQTKGLRVAIGNTIHESPSVIFREDMHGEHASQSTAKVCEDDSASDSDFEDIMNPTSPAESLLPATQESTPTTSSSQHGATGVEQAAPAGGAGTMQVDPQTNAVPPDQQSHPPRRSQRARGPPDRFVPGQDDNREARALPAEGAVEIDDISDLLDIPCIIGSAFASEAQKVPKNYADIANWDDMQEMWYASVAKELRNLTDMKVVEEIAERDVPHGSRILTSKLDFRNKYDPSGNIAERKTRLCVRGFMQVEGIDYTEVFAPTAAANTTRALFAVAAHNNLHVHQMDVKAAFLHAPITEELYMRPPVGIPHLQGKVWRLHKAIYGLKQAAHAWHATLKEQLNKYGFKPSLTDPCLFVKLEGEQRTYLLAYVDDLLIGGGTFQCSQSQATSSRVFQYQGSGCCLSFSWFPDPP
jgi:hypothetical protein